MSDLDLRTVLFTNLAGYAVCTLVIALLWQRSRGRFAGLGLLVSDFILQVSGLGLIAVRGVVHAWISVALANCLIMLGSVLGLIGLERFVGKPRTQVHNYVLLGVYAVVFVGFVVFEPTEARTRSLAVSIGLLIVWVQCAWLMIVRVDRALRPATMAVGVVFSLFCLLNVVRIGELVFASPTISDYLRAGTLEAAVMVSYGVLATLLTVSLVLMVNRRLMTELQSEEAKFTTVFKSSPYAIVLTRLADGTIVEVNDGFTRLSGYTYQEAVGRTTADLRLYVEDDARGVLLRELRERGRLHEREVQFRPRHGRPLTGLVSAGVIDIEGEAYVLSSVSDISERKRMEEEIRELSLRDALTGLYNRRGFFTVAEQRIKEANRDRVELHLIFIDLDGLKEINDTLGHTEGDRTLVDAAKVLTATYRQSDIIARVGGDEFVVLSPDSTVVGAEASLSRLFASLDAFNRREARPYTLAMSWGAAVYDPAAPRALDDLMAEADQRMYEHKRGDSEGGSGLRTEDGAPGLRIPRRADA
jgi:diguanylate cyclase (GGDEF)-like protein/PAS domain S-box-containing protein